MSISKMTQRPRFYLAISYPIASVDDIARALPQHLQYMAEHEDKLFLAGPFIGSGGEGMSILWCTSEHEATEFMQGDPFVAQGLRRFELRQWELRFGTPSLATLSAA
jgi:uncharacterized protein YciI